MMKTLQKHGNDYVLVIEKTFLEALGIDEDTPLEITVSGGSLVITPVPDGIGTEELKRILAEIRAQYRETFRRLAE